LATSASISSSPGTLWFEHPANQVRTDPLVSFAVWQGRNSIVGGRLWEGHLYDHSIFSLPLEPKRELSTLDAKEIRMVVSAFVTDLEKYLHV